MRKPLFGNSKKNFFWHTLLRQWYPFLKVRSFGDTVRKSGRPELQNWRDPQLNGRQRKQVRYRTIQELRQTDWRGLAKVLLEEESINPRPPAIGHVERVYKERFSEKAIDWFSMTNKVKINIVKGSEIRLLHPRRPEEVGAAMKDQKTQSTSGPDDISVRGLRKVGALNLTLIFSCWLTAGRTP